MGGEAGEGGESGPDHGAVNTVHQKFIGFFWEGSHQKDVFMSLLPKSFKITMDVSSGQFT